MQATEAVQQPDYHREGSQQIESRTAITCPHDASVCINSDKTSTGNMDWARDNTGLSDYDLTSVFKYEPKQTAAVLLLATQSVC